MAALWEPVDGVFWSTPPAALDEAWSYLPITPVLAVAIIAGLKVWQRIKVKRLQPDWKLRQHMVEIGTAITVAYLFAMFVLVCVRGSQVLTMPLNEVGDFLAGAFGPVAFLWLVLGFLQQGDELRQGTEALRLQATELRNSVEQQKVMAAAATQQIDAQKSALELKRIDRERSLLANFSLRSMESGPGIEQGTAFTKVLVRNDGNHAYNPVMLFDPPIGVSRPFGIGDKRKDEEVILNLIYLPVSDPVLGSVSIEYLDSEGRIRRQHFNYTLVEDSLRFTKIVPAERT